QQVYWLEPTHDDRNVKLVGNLLVLFEPHHRAAMARSDETLHAIARRFEDQAHRRRYQHMRNKHREITNAFAFGLIYRHRVRRSGGFESHPKENDLPL